MTFPECRKRVMYIGKCDDKNTHTGREALSRSIVKVVGSIDCDVYKFEIGEPHTPKWISYILGVGGWLNGATPSLILEINDFIESQKIDTVLIDGSNYGAIASSISKRFPNVKIITFFHNCEAVFFISAFKQFKTIKSLFVAWCNFVAERSACRFSNTLVCLTERDSLDLERFYGRRADYIVPIFLDPSLDCEDYSRPIKEDYCLFVGGGFFANVEAAKWISTELAEVLPISIIIVGQGMDKYSDILSNEKVNVFGGVDTLYPFYYHARFVISPITIGSGMKTKVAEALKYGKFIAGSQLSFEGYGSISADIGRICNSREDYLALCLEMLSGKVNHDVCLARQTFANRHSFSSAKKRFEKIIFNACH